MVRQVQSLKIAVSIAAPRARKSLASAEAETPVEEFNRAYFNKCLEDEEGTSELYCAVDKCIKDRDRYYIRIEQQKVDHAILAARIEELEEDLQSS